jgi:SAM-dependent methyltransferase
MSIDVVDLRNFYAQRLGVVARRFVGRGIRRRFADTRGMRVLGIGYTTPYLGLFREEAERCLAFMPAAQGVVKWPSNRPSLAALVDELDLPLNDAAVDRVLLVHALEMAHDPIDLLREVWRVMAAGGRLLLVIPNRRGVWALFALSDYASAARILVHSHRLGRGAACAAGGARLVSAFGGRLGADRICGRHAVRRRPHRGGHEAGLPGDTRAAGAHSTHTGIGAGARAGR